jgi:hypothetical protein
MAYSYPALRADLFTEEGSTRFIKDRDAVLKAMKATGAIRMGEAMRFMQASDTWTMLATMDRLCELGDVKEITAAGLVMGQERVFVLCEK